MKNLKIIGLLIITIIGLNSCDQQDDLVFTAQEPAEGINFSNSFLDEYVLTTAASKNLGERFTWNDANFGVPTNVTYELQNSILGDFTDATIISSTDGNELAVTIGQMLGFAGTAGLDNDPNTENPNTGQLYFRIKAFVGTDNGLETFSDVQALNVVLPEVVLGGGAFEKSSWGVVGSGYNNWSNDLDGFKAPKDAPFYTTATAGVIVSYVNLLDGEIKFRENNSWDAPDINVGDTGADGTLEEGGDNIAVTAGDYKITIDTNDMSYTIEKFSWGIVGSGFNNWGNTPGVSDAKFYYDYTTDTFKASVKLFTGEIKFRQNNSWDAPAINVGDNGADGTLEEGGANIAVTEGHYLITLNLNDNSYSIAAAPVLGITGSGYNDWGNNVWDHDGDAGSPDVKVSDAALTEIQPGVWLAENITLLDGEIKLRQNNSWDAPDLNYGDNGADGILEEGGDNIAVTAGNYVITIDFNDVAGPKYSLGKRQ
jgi:hypothetical protein